ncbi:exodeoxyribonuclease VII small subunit [candidate division KSB1 bacterium]|nr:exodeoxyribonuclease VII small subunit [candidate division KSB1 bacterium]
MAKMTFESAISRLEEIAALLEEGAQTLDDTLKLYEESNQLLTFCMKRLSDAEKKIKLLKKTADGFEVEEAELD